MDEQEVETTQETQEQEFDVSSLPDIERSAYSQENYRNAKELRTIQFQKRLMDEIDDAHIYFAAKKALRILVAEALSQDWVLANLETGNQREGTDVNEYKAAHLNFELKYLAAKASFCKSDVNSPDMHNIINALRDHFKVPVLSRAKGKQRERIVNSTNTIDYKMTTRQELPEPQRQSAAQRAKKSIWSR